MVNATLAALAVQVGKVAGRATRPRKAAVELTDAAVLRIKELLDKRHKVRIVLAGCNK